MQDIHVPQWQQNQMLTLEVEDLEGYWREIEVLKLPDAFPGVSMKPPADLPWGREVHIIDPAGVCWHIRQAA